MAVRVYRVQDSAGRGPFKPGFSQKWANKDFDDEVLALPSFLEEFGLDVIDRLGRKGEYFGSAVLALAELRKWFSTSERHQLQKLGYHPVSMVADRILAESKHQVLFARNTPLNISAIRLSWQRVDENS